MLTDGELIDNKYQLLGQIAQGDFGVVYQAREMESGSVYTLRFFTRRVGSDGSLVSRLRQESGQLQKLQHPNIMPFGEVGEIDGQVYAARKFVEGVTLQDLLAREAPFRLWRACSIARQIASALETAHNEGVLHGNLNPANVLVNEQDGLSAVKVLGLGSFSLTEGQSINMARLVLSGSDGLFGSPEYISPEQAVGTQAETLDGRSDIYSLGVILYQMLAGEPPFHSSNAMQVLLGHLFDEPPPLHGRPGIDVPEVVETLVMRSLAKKREMRPSSATAFVDQLQPWEKPAGTYRSSPEAAQVAARFTSLQKDSETGRYAPADADVGPGAEEPAEVSSPFDFDESQPQSTPPARGTYTLPVTSPYLVADFGRQESRAVESAQAPPLISAPPPAQSSELTPTGPTEHDTFIIAGAEAGREALTQGLNATDDPGIDIDVQTIPAAPPRKPAPLVGSHVTAGQVIFGPYRQPQTAPGSRHKALTAAALILVGIAAAGASLYYTGRGYWLRPQYVWGRISSSVSHTPPPSAAVSSPSASPSSAAPAVPPPVTSGGAASAGPSLNVPSPAARGSQTGQTSTGSKTSNAAVAGLSAGGAKAASPRQPPSAIIGGYEGSKALNEPHASRPVTMSPSQPHSSEGLAVDTSDAVRDAIRRGNYYFLRGEYNNAIKAYTAGLAVSPGNAALLAEVARTKKAQAAEAEFLGH